VATPQGFAVFVLLEKKEAREPAFAEVRGDLLGREDAARRRRAFDDLIARLRSSAAVQMRSGGDL